MIDGRITDQQGPYTVTVTRALDLNADSAAIEYVSGLTIKLFDSQQNCEDFTEVSPGIYETSGLITGTVGNAYYIRVETSDGQYFESEPDILHPVGTLENISYEYEARTKLDEFGEFAADVFNVYVDATAVPNTSNYIRWKFEGIYEVLSFPHLREIQYAYSDLPRKSPHECSGYIVEGTGQLGVTILTQVAPCECCVCWARQVEQIPVVADDQLVAGGQFSKVKVAEVPINDITFHKKYMVNVEQMSLSQSAYNFFKIVKDQKEQNTDLFQPPPGEVRGNFKITNGISVIGLFWATSIQSKSIFIDRTDVPYPVTPIRQSVSPCYDAYPYASTEIPNGWE